MDKWVKANDWVGSHLFYIVLSAVLLGLFVPIPQLHYLKEMVIVIFAYITFVTSLGTGFKKFISVLKKPGIPVWILILSHIIVPVFAWIYGSLFYHGDAMMRMGLLIIASIPVAVTSILWTSIVGGNIAVTILAVTIDTLIAPVLLPFMFIIIIGTHIQINYVSMVLQLFMMVTIPSIAGMLITDATKGKLDKFAKGSGGLTSRLALFFVIFFNTSLVSPEVILSASLVKTLLLVLLLVISGFAIGYLGSFALKERSWETIMAVVYSVGMRNIAFGLVLAIAYFPTAVSIPVTLAILFQQPTAALISYIYKRYILVNKAQ